MKILVIAAHPDDEVLGSGATVARWVQEGHDVHLAVLGEGVTSRFDVREDGLSSGSGELEALRQSMNDAARSLGIQRKTTALDLPDNRFDSVDLLDVVKRVESVIDAYEPDRVLTHHVGDLNVDHRITAQAVITATRPQPGHKVRDLWTFETPSATEWAYGSPSLFSPNVFVDVSNTLTMKIDALHAYGAEMRAAPHARSIEAVRAWACVRGHSVGVPAAEAFQILRSIQ